MEYNTKELERILDEILEETMNSEFVVYANAKFWDLLNENIIITENYE